jgi:16S rRNA (guanine966-N2)-methyltransferase
VSVRVIAGTHGGRRLRTPKGADTRPTSELIRGAIFNSLDAQGVVEGAVVADLFAGSGALGIEALSRGAARAVFVDASRAATAAIAANLQDLQMHGTVVTDKVERWVQRSPTPCDIVFADPPYRWESWTELLGVLATFPAALVVAESDTELAHDDWRVTGVSRHGGTVVTQLRPRGAHAS